ncbi:hypothetical protein DNK47_01230 [Mycoplasma wenyonii]|uniref:Uncharacterized protein n=1 Tax=Mycoplasma wenyonii TaxID=65123 RepID=A0A328PQR9_9MOLU|nr:hypothetical protein [Mycoplasma wenyonii]RAO95228.1 hypothetical protein DNK47_01230 [Mycoplasma wenyonii]
MIPFKFFAPALVGLTGVGWVISGVVQKPAPKTIMDFVEMGTGGCIKGFKVDRVGNQPKISCTTGGGDSGCCSASG